MSADGLLGKRKLRRIKDLTGIEAVRGWAWHPYWEFIDADHNHYILNTRGGSLEHRDFPVVHYTSCPSRG